MRNHVRSAVAAAAAFTAIGLGPALAEPAISLPDPGFAPEGISASDDGALYLGSITQGRIIRIAPNHKDVSEFAPAGANKMVSVIGVHVSADDDYVYACSSDPGPSALTGTAPPALVRFKRSGGAVAGRFELPEGGVICNDIAELPDGTILATDSFTPRIYALRPGATALEIWFEDPGLAAEGFNLNGVAYDAGAVYVLQYGVGAMHKIPLKADGAAGDAVKIYLPRAIAGADGLNALGDGRFLIVEGGGLTAGARGGLLGVTVEGADGRLETIADDLNVPTTAEVIDGVAYIVEGQLDHIFDPNAGPADPYRVLKIKLPKKFR